VVVSSLIVTAVPAVAQVNAEPLQVSAVLAKVGATTKVVAPTPLWNGI